MLFLELCLGSKESILDCDHHQQRIVLGHGQIMLPCQQDAHVLHRQAEAVRQALIRFGRGRRLRHVVSNGSGRSGLFTRPVLRSFFRGQIVAHASTSSYRMSACSTQERIWFQ